MSLKKTKNKKNIAFVVQHLRYGGAEKALMHKLDSINYSKYNVDLIVLAKEQSDVYDINKNVNVRYIYETVDLLYKDNSKGEFNLKFEKEYDIEIAYLGIFTSWVIYKFGTPNAKKITWIHNDIKYMIGDNSKEYVNNLYSKMDKIICVSQGTKESFIDFLGNQLEEKLEVIYNPIDTKQIIEMSSQEIEYKKNKFTILAIGRLSSEKGFDRLIKIHKKLIDNGIENELIILGNGYEEEKFKKMIKDFKIEDSCKLIGYVKNPYQFTKMCDLFVSPSYLDALPLVIIEAMVLNKPIVATDTYGSKALLKNNLGLITENNEEGLYNGMKNMILNNEMRKSYMKNLKKIKNFDFDKSIVMPQIEKLFDEEKKDISISLCMIVKNEEDVIGRCLDSVKDIVDEIIIVDTGSNDKTKEIVKNYTDKIYDFKWIDDFSAARNFSFSKATKEYIFWIDADEVLLEKDKEKLLKLKENLNHNIDVVSMDDHRGLNENGQPLLVYKRDRLVKKSKNFKWIGFIHEYIAVNGKTFESDIAITHKKIHDAGDRNLKIYRKKIDEGKVLSQRDIYHYGKELYYNKIYDEAIKILEHFLSMEIWIEERLDALCKLSDCYFFKDDYKKAREILYKTFECTTPRAEAVYRIAMTFETQKRYEEAISWYESIINLNFPKECRGYIRPEYWTWKPHLQLTVCYYKLNNKEKSLYHHKQAYKINPNNPAIIGNQNYFEGK